MEGTIAVIILVNICITIFVIYFISKILQFVITATNLYKKIINREDTVIQLLLDIRDNTKKYDGTKKIDEEISSSSNGYVKEYKKSICENCKAYVPSNSIKCPNCGSEFE